MRIHEIIKERRKSAGLTQEQAAACLGISASAFNKWERGASYPDITILPALARLLEVDLNTLLSFKEELTDQEIALWVQQISDKFLSDGFEEGYKMGMEKIREYPGCGSLLYTVAATLEGGLFLFPTHIQQEERAHYLSEIEKLYLRAAKSKDDCVRIQANALLASKYINRGEYDNARERIECLPDGYMADKQQIQAKLCYQTGEYEEAARLWENKILRMANDIFMGVYMLMEIAVKEEYFKDARYFADKAVKTIELYEMWEYSAYTAEFQLAVACQDKAACMQILKKMLPALEKDWNPADKKLYSHIREKEGKERRLAMRKQLLQGIIQELPRDGEMAFLKDEEEFKQLINRYTN